MNDTIGKHCNGMFVKHHNNKVDEHHKDTINKHHNNKMVDGIQLTNVATIDDHLLPAFMMATSCRLL
jgi:hypothetical protein